MKRYVIIVNTPQPKWVSGTFPRVGGMVGAELTDKEELAKDFLTMHNANSVIDRIHNPFDRVFTAVISTVAPAAQEDGTVIHSTKRVIK